MSKLFWGSSDGVHMPLVTDSFEQSHHPAAMTLVGLQRWGQFAALGFVFPFINVCTREH